MINSYKGFQIRLARLLRTLGFSDELQSQFHWDYTHDYVWWTRPSGELLIVVSHDNVGLYWRTRNTLSNSPNDLDFKNAEGVITHLDLLAILTSNGDKYPFSPEYMKKTWFGLGALTPNWKRINGVLISCGLAHKHTPMPFSIEGELTYGSE